MAGRATVLVLSEIPDVRKVVARVLRYRRYAVLEAGDPRQAIDSDRCDLVVIDVSGRSEDTDAVARHLLASGVAAGALFFDSSSIRVALRSLRALTRDVGEALSRFRS